MLVKIRRIIKELFEERQPEILDTEDVCTHCDGLGLQDFMTECIPCDGQGRIKKKYVRYVESLK